MEHRTIQMSSTMRHYSCYVNTAEEMYHAGELRRSDGLELLDETFNSARCAADKTQVLYLDREEYCQSKVALEMHFEITQGVCLAGLGLPLVPDDQLGRTRY